MNTETATKAEQIISDLSNAIMCLEALENSILFIPERKDKDLSRPCAAAAEAICKMLGACQDDLIEIFEKVPEA